MVSEDRVANRFLRAVGERVPAALVTEASKKVLVEVQAIMRAKGLKYGANKASAQGEWTWSATGKPKFNEPSFSIGGWHGTGKWGEGMVLGDVYIQKTGQTNPEKKNYVAPGKSKDDYAPWLPEASGSQTGYPKDWYEGYLKWLPEIVKLAKEYKPE